MKKITILLLLLISIFLISCYDTSNKNYIELKEVSILDEDGNQIMGTIWSDYQLDEVVGNFYYTMNGKSNTGNIQKLNSAAPVTYVYTLDANLHASYTVNMKFALKGNKQLAKINLSESSYYNSYNLEYTIIGPTEEDDRTTVSFQIDTLTANNSLYILTGYTLIEKGKEVDYRYTVSGGSRHFRAIYFNLGDYYHLDRDIIEFNRNFKCEFILGQDVTHYDFSNYNVTEEEGKKIITHKEESEYTVIYNAEYITVNDSNF